MTKNSGRRAILAAAGGDVEPEYPQEKLCSDKLVTRVLTKQTGAAAFKAYQMYRSTINSADVKGLAVSVLSRSLDQTVADTQFNLPQSNRKRAPHPLLPAPTHHNITLPERNERIV